MIRRATPADAAALAELAAATFPLACPPHAAADDIQLFIDTHLSEAAFTEYLADENRAVLVADDFAGYTLLVFQEPTDVDVAAAISTRPTAELSKLYVRPSSHGSGIAAQLIEASCELAAEWGAKAVWLGVNQQNDRANRFYEKNGFTKVGTKRFRLGTNWEEDFVRERVL